MRFASSREADDVRAMAVANLYIGILALLEGLPYQQRLEATLRIFMATVLRCEQARWPRAIPVERGRLNAP